MAFQWSGGVPPLPGRSRYNVVNTTATWCYHHMANGVALTGDAPRTAAKTASELDPVVSAGKAEFSNLTEGGLFTLQANAKKTLVIDAIDNPGNATIAILNRDGTHQRTAPTSTPFKVMSSEVIKASGGSAGGYIGVLYKIDGEEIW